MNAIVKLKKKFIQFANVKYNNLLCIDKMIFKIF